MAVVAPVKDSLVGLVDANAPMPGLATLRNELLATSADDSAVVRRDRDRAALMLLHLDDPAVVLDLGLEHLVTEIGTTRGDAALMVASEATYRPTAVVADAAAVDQVASTPLPNQHPILQSVWHANEPLTFARIVGNPHLGTLGPVFEDLDMSAMLARSITFDGRALGVLCLDETESVRSWRPETVTRVDEFIGRWLGPLVFHALRRWVGARHSCLTQAERTCIELLAEGASYDEIARRLGKSVRTVDNQLRSARAKTGARNGIELIRRSGVDLQS